MELLAGALVDGELCDHVLCVFSKQPCLDGRKEQPHLLDLKQVCSIKNARIRSAAAAPDGEVQVFGGRGERERNLLGETMWTERVFGDDLCLCQQAPNLLVGAK